MSSQSFEHQVNQSLTRLTLQLKSQGLWQKHKPDLAELSSTMPFCCDTLAFEQWLQFVFIVKIDAMIANRMPLPQNIALTPMAEESFKFLEGSTSQLIKILAQIDLLLSAER